MSIRLRLLSYSRYAILFSCGIHIKSKYSSEELLNALRNALAHKIYSETYVRKLPYNTYNINEYNVKWLYKADLNHAIGILKMLIDCIVNMAIKMNAFNNLVNVPIAEHDELYTGKDNSYR